MNLKFIERAEESIFAEHESYESMGSWIYYVAAVIGAIVGLVAAYVAVSDDGSFVAPGIYIFTSIFMSIAAWCLIDSMVRIDNIRVAWGKTAFNCGGVFVAMLLGMIVSVVVLVVVCLIFLFLLFTGGLKAALSGSGSSRDDGDVVTSDGETMHHVTGNIYRSSRDGNDYEKIGDTMHRL